MARILKSKLPESGLPNSSAPPPVPVDATRPGDSAWAVRQALNEGAVAKRTGNPSAGRDESIRKAGGLDGPQQGAISATSAMVAELQRLLAAFRSAEGRDPEGPDEDPNFWRAFRDIVARRAGLSGQVKPAPR